MSDRIGIKVEKTNDKISIIIPPAYAWKSHNMFFYIVIISYSIFSITNIWFAMSISNLGIAYTFCSLLLLICGRLNAVVVQYAHFAFSIAILSDHLTREGSYVSVALGTLAFVEPLFFTGFKNSIFKDIFGSTHIDVNQSKLSVYRKIWFLYQAEFTRKVDSERAKRVVEILFRDSYSATLYQKVWLKNEIRFNRSSHRVRDISYLLGYFLSKNEKKRILQMIALISN